MKNPFKKPIIITGLCFLTCLYGTVLNSQENPTQWEELFKESVERFFLNTQEDSTQRGKLFKESVELLKKGEFDRALKITNRAIALGGNKADDFQSRATLHLRMLAYHSYVLKRYPESERLFKRVIVFYEKSKEKDHLGLITAHTELGNFYRGRKRYPEAKTVYQRILKLEEKELGLNDPIIAKNLSDFAWFFVEQGLTQDAEVHYKRAHSIYVKVLGERHPDVACSLFNLSVLSTIMRRTSEAAKFKARAMDQYDEFKKKLGGENPELIAMRHCMERCVITEAMSKLNIKNYKYFPKGFYEDILIYEGALKEKHMTLENIIYVGDNL